MTVIVCGSSEPYGFGNNEAQLNAVPLKNEGKFDIAYPTAPLAPPMKMMVMMIAVVRKIGER